MQIAKIPPGSIVTLLFKPGTPYEKSETALFVKAEGQGDDARATFMQTGPDGKLHDWDAYKYNGRWSFGSSAERMSVLNIVTAI